MCAFPSSQSPDCLAKVVELWVACYEGEYEDVTLENATRKKISRCASNGVWDQHVQAAYKKAREEAYQVVRGGAAGQAVDEGTNGTKSADEAYQVVRGDGQAAYARVMARPLADRASELEAIKAESGDGGSGESKNDGVLIVESKHNYDNYMDDEREIHFPGAVAIAIAFHPQCSTESGYDYLRFRREAGSDTDPWIKETFTGTGSERWPTKPVIIEAEKFFAYFHSDDSGVDWGYRFACVPVMLTEIDGETCDDSYIRELRAYVAAGTQIAQPEHMLEKMDSSLGRAHQYSIGGDDDERHMIQKLDLWQQPQRGSLEEGNDLIHGGVQMTLEAAMTLSTDSDAIGFCWHGAKDPESTVTVFLKDNNCSKDISQRPRRPSEVCDVSLPAGVSAWHRAEEAVTDDGGRVCSWPDASGNGVTLVLPDAQGSAPSLVPASNTFPAYVRFAKCENEGLVYPDSFRLAGSDENADVLQYSVFIVNRYYGSPPNGRTLQSRDTNWL